MALEAIGAGNDLRNQIGIMPRSLEHAMSLGGIEAHTGFRQHVLAGFKSRQRHGAMQIGPSADHHGVDLGIGD